MGVPPVTVEVWETVWQSTGSFATPRLRDVADGHRGPAGIRPRPAGGHGEGGATGEARAAIGSGRRPRTGRRRRPDTCRLLAHGHIPRQRKEEPAGTAALIEVTDSG